MVQLGWDQLCPLKDFILEFMKLFFKTAMVALLSGQRVEDDSHYYFFAKGLFFVHLRSTLSVDVGNKCFLNGSTTTSSRFLKPMRVGLSTAPYWTSNLVEYISVLDICQASLYCCNNTSWSWSDYIPCNVPVRSTFLVFTLKVCLRVSYPHSSYVPSQVTKHKWSETE